MTQHPKKNQRSTFLKGAKDGNQAQPLDLMHRYDPNYLKGYIRGLDRRREMLLQQQQMNLED
ncbi:MAG: hypothetical protein F6K31_07830 [Symploca sp. SIO2G7]|nr:hypothetical protein [Symploca sp. SIO2G7]